MKNNKTRFVSFLMMIVLAMALALSACTKTATKTEVETVDANVIEKVAAEYIVSEFGKHFDKADASIPEIYLVATEVSTDGDVTAYGDFFLENFDVKGDTLESVSGGDFAGVMYMTKDGDGYKVVKFDQVEDGEGYTESAKKLFGDYYEAYAKYTSDDDAKKKVQTEAIKNYVKENNLKVTQYQEFGWEPVALS